MSYWFVSMPPNGIGYSTSGKKIGFRGISKGMAAMFPLPPKGHNEELFFFQGINVPAEKLPYLPKMGPKSRFVREGHWHFYKIKASVSIVFIEPTKPKQTMHQVLHAIHFDGEETPRLFLDRRKELKKQKLLSPRDLRRVDEILTKSDIVLV